ncbi:MAG: hypothetical protein Q8K28_15390 [Hoeflea sp.]|uniref:hypothetical protein n=1 Tax=Hoeflea sp. TaxID=1940281 RepID=UPI00272F7169|nr:hypothetical protein [Hoeflea sp.]MDP2121279.1 hypothetical protein [Hoeflea sp.]
MKFNEKTENPLGQLVEMSTRTVESNIEMAADIFVTLCFGVEDIELEEYTVSIKFRRAYLTTEPNGGRIDPNLKHGIRKHPERIARETEIEKSTKTTVSNNSAREAIVSGKFSPIDQSIEASRKGKKETSEVAEVQLSERNTDFFEHIPVEAQGNDRWIICNEKDISLSGYYLNNDRLCRIIMDNGRPNRFGISIAVEIKRQDIAIEITKNTRWFPLVPNKEKLLNALIGQRLASIAHGRNDRAITFAKSDTFVNSEVDHEG